MEELVENMHGAIVTFGAIVFSMVVLSSCTRGISNQEGESEGMDTNLVSYFEIPVSDMDRAIDFYETVFSVSLERTMVDGNDMALFPFDENGTGISGALAKGNSYVPSASGPRIYFFVENIDETLSQAITMGGQLAYEKTSVGNFWVAEFEDSEGNQIALSSVIE